MYRDAADEDYLLARFAARSNLIYQFWWSAQQTLEKYLKGALLLNGHAVDSFGHRLVDMYSIAQDFSQDLLPLLYCPPNCVVSQIWPNPNSRGFEKLDCFVKRVETLGNPNSRYRLISNYTSPEDLIKFDQLSFYIRRICFPLDMTLQNTQMSVRQFLTSNRSLQLHPKMSFEGALSGQHENVWRPHFEWCNFTYFYDKTRERGEYPSWGGSINAEPFLALQSNDVTYHESLLWISTNAFPKQLRKEISEALEAR